MEEWLPVVDYEGLYEVSDHGRVRRVETGRVLKLIRTKRGYFQVNLSCRNEVKSVTVHSLVAGAFIGPRPQGFETCHGDGDGLNNRKSNLRYDTHQSNLLDRRRHGTSSTNAGETNAQSILTAADIIAIRSLSAPNIVIAERFSISPSHVSKILARKAWAHVP